MDPTLGAMATTSVATKKRRAWTTTVFVKQLMAVSGLFLLLYGLFRSLIELVRVPDAHLGYLAGGWLTMGQLLSLPMAAAGLVLLGLAYRSRGRGQDGL